MNSVGDREARVLVTGGTRGIGLGIAQAFASDGARVAIASRSHDGVQSAQRALGSCGSPVTGIQGDVSTVLGCRRIIRRAVAALGGLDVLCVNAGIYPELPIGQLTGKHFERVVNTNLRGTVFLVDSAVSALADSGRGRVIVTGSITGSTTGYPGLSVYAATKAGQIGFVRTAAVELAAVGITVNALSPGSIETEGLAGLGAEATAQMAQTIPVGRLGKPNEIGSAAVYLASPRAGFITGQEIIIDGGQTLPELPGFI